MQNGATAVRNRRHPKPRRSSSGRPKRGISRQTADATRPEDAHNARKSYERYLALARAEAQAGDLISAENLYQHAEHYFRSMHSERDQTEGVPVKS